MTAAEPETRDHDKRLKKTLIWLTVATLLFLVVGVLSWLSQFRDVPLAASESTTIFVEPLNSRGQVDFAKAYQDLNQSGDLDSDENGFRHLIQNLKLNDVSSEEIRSLRRQLGLVGSNPSPKIQLVDPREFLSDYMRSGKSDDELIGNLIKDSGDQSIIGPDGFRSTATELLLSRATRPWLAKDLPMMREWIRENEQALDVYAEAVRHPVFEIPLIWVDHETELYNLRNPDFFRIAAQGFVIRANFYLAIGDFRKAMDDILSCKRLGRHCRNSNMSITVMMGIALESIADSIGIAYPGNGVVPKDDLEYLASQYATLPEADDMSMCLLQSKLELLEYTREISLTDDHAFLDVNDSIKKLRSLGLDWNIVSIELQKLIDQHLGEFELPLQDINEITNLEYIFRSVRSRKFAAYMATYTSAIHAGMEADRRARCRQNLKRITIALLCYEADHGRLPPAFTTNEKGEPLQSWRVLILPYLGERELYTKIRLDEPWNSPHNSTCASVAPPLFSCPGCSNCEADQTCYTVIVGKDLPFSGSKGVSIDRYGPESDDMLLVAERQSPVNWMDPRQEISRTQALMGISPEEGGSNASFYLGGHHPDGAHFGFRNGSVDFVSKDLDPGVLADIIEGINTKSIHD